ncbi:hypothetical protein D9M68_72600 [compost metagenome]
MYGRPRSNVMPYLRYNENDFHLHTPAWSRWPLGGRPRHELLYRELVTPLEAD